MLKHWGVKVKNDIEDARVLSKALHLAKDDQIKVPVYDEDVERIKELMSYYKFTSKQTTQQKNHLESLVSKDGDSFAIHELKKSIKESKEKEQRIIDKIQIIIDSNVKYKLVLPFSQVIESQRVGPRHIEVLFLWQRCVPFVMICSIISEIYRWRLTPKTLKMATLLASSAASHRRSDDATTTKTKIQITWFGEEYCTEE